MLTPGDEQLRDQIVEDFHRVYYNDWDRTWEDTHWQGIKILKCPLDLWVYQEILWDQRPDLIIETGTAHGGSALWFAQMCDLMGHGQVVTIDIMGPQFFPDRVPHPRIQYLEGSSTDPAIIEQVQGMLQAGGWISTLVVLDSDHRADHVYDELVAWSGAVHMGGYIVVEDGNVNGHPVVPEHGPGPTEAVARFLADTNEFEIDRGKEKYMMTFNPGGFLRRIG